MKTVIFILILLGVPLSHVRPNVLNQVGHGVYSFLSSEHTQNIGFVLLSATGDMADAYRDGWVWDNMYDDGITYGVNNRNWHIFKNISRTANWSAMGLLGLSIGQKHTSVKLAICRFVAMKILCWGLWDLSYRHARYNAGYFKNWDVSRLHNEHAVLYFNPVTMEDKFIGFHGNQVIQWNLGRLVTGVIALFKTKTY